MPLSHQEILHISTLCRIGMSETDLEQFGSQLSHILEQFEVLSEIETDDVPPTAHPSTVHSIFKQDGSRPSLSREQTLQNAPRQEGEHLRIQAVLED